MIRAFLTLFLLLLLAFPGHAADIDRMAGRYIYEDYSFAMPSGVSGGFKELGAHGATLEIGRDMSITMTMHMLDGSDLVSHAQITELHLDSNGGYWLAKWPDLHSPVRKEFQLTPDTIKYVIRFDDPADPYHYGGSDQGTLRRESASAQDGS